MSSIWTSGATAQAGISPFQTTGLAPDPGGGAATRFQSLLKSMGNASPAGGATAGGQASNVQARTAVAASPMDTATSSSSGSSSDNSATITGNDFLTLLVTEMQNQDPTADTDPNAYIDQLVQINSLEQLISINQNLADVLGAASSTPPSTTPSTPPSTSHSASPSTSAAASPSAAALKQRAQPGLSTGGVNGAAMSHPAVSGNLSVPAATPASRTVSHSLDGHPRLARPGHGIRDIPTH